MTDAAPPPPPSSSCSASSTPPRFRHRPSQSRSGAGSELARALARRRGAAVGHSGSSATITAGRVGTIEEEQDAEGGGSEGRTAAGTAAEVKFGEGENISEQQQSCCSTEQSSSFSSAASSGSTATVGAEEAATTEAGARKELDRPAPLSPAGRVPVPSRRNVVEASSWIRKGRNDGGGDDGSDVEGGDEAEGKDGCVSTEASAEGSAGVVLPRPGAPESDQAPQAAEPCIEPPLSEATTALLSPAAARRKRTFPSASSWIRRGVQGEEEKEERDGSDGVADSSCLASSSTPGSGGRGSVASSETDAAPTPAAARDQPQGRPLSSPLLTRPHVEGSATTAVAATPPHWVRRARPAANRDEEDENGEGGKGANIASASSVSNSAPSQTVSVDFSSLSPEHGREGGGGGGDSTAGVAGGGASFLSDARRRLRPAGGGGGSGSASAASSLGLAHPQTPPPPQRPSLRVQWTPPMSSSPSSPPSRSPVTKQLGAEETGGHFPPPPPFRNRRSVAEVPTPPTLRQTPPRAAAAPPPPLLPAAAKWRISVPGGPGLPGSCVQSSVVKSSVASDKNAGAARVRIAPHPRDGPSRRRPGSVTSASSASSSSEDTSGGESSTTSSSSGRVGIRPLRKLFDASHSKKGARKVGGRKIVAPVSNAESDDVRGGPGEEGGGGERKGCDDGASSEPVQSTASFLADARCRLRPSGAEVEEITSEATAKVAPSVADARVAPMSPQSYGTVGESGSCTIEHSTPQKKRLTWASSKEEEENEGADVSQLSPQQAAKQGDRSSEDKNRPLLTVLGPSGVGDGISRGGGVGGSVKDRIRMWSLPSAPPPLASSSLSNSGPSLRIGSMVASQSANDGAVAALSSPQAKARVEWTPFEVSEAVTEKGCRVAENSATKEEVSRTAMAEVDGADIATTTADALRVHTGNLPPTTVAAAEVEGAAIETATADAPQRHMGDLPTTMVVEAEGDISSPAASGPDAGAGTPSPPSRVQPPQCRVSFGDEPAATFAAATTLAADPEVPPARRKLPPMMTPRLLTNRAKELARRDQRRKFLVPSTSSTTHLGGIGGTGRRLSGKALPSSEGDNVVIAVEGSADISGGALPSTAVVEEAEAAAGIGAATSKVDGSPLPSKKASGGISNESGVYQKREDTKRRDASAVVQTRRTRRSIARARFTSLAEAKRCGHPRGGQHDSSAPCINTATTSSEPAERSADDGGGWEHTPRTVSFKQGSLPLPEAFTGTFIASPPKSSPHNAAKLGSGSSPRKFSSNPVKVLPVTQPTLSSANSGRRGSAQREPRYTPRRQGAHGDLSFPGDVGMASEDRLGVRGERGKRNLTADPPEVDQPMESNSADEGGERSAGEKKFRGRVPSSRVVIESAGGGGDGTWGELAMTSVGDGVNAISQPEPLQSRLPPRCNTMQKPTRGLPTSSSGKLMTTPHPPCAEGTAQPSASGFVVPAEANPGGRHKRTPSLVSIDSITCELRHRETLPANVPVNSPLEAIGPGGVSSTVQPRVSPRPRLLSNAVDPVAGEIGICRAAAVGGSDAHSGSGNAGADACGSDIPLVIGVKNDAPPAASVVKASHLCSHSIVQFVASPVNSTVTSTSNAVTVSSLRRAPAVQPRSQPAFYSPGGASANLTSLVSRSAFEAKFHHPSSGTGSGGSAFDPSPGLVSSSASDNWESNKRLDVAAGLLLPAFSGNSSSSDAGGVASVTSLEDENRALKERLRYFEADLNERDAIIEGLKRRVRSSAEEGNHQSSATTQREEILIKDEYGHKGPRRIESNTKRAMHQKSYTTGHAEDLGAVGGRRFLC